MERFLQNNCQNQSHVHKNCKKVNEKSDYKVCLFLRHRLIQSLKNKYYLSWVLHVIFIAGRAMYKTLGRLWAVLAAAVLVIFSPIPQTGKVQTVSNTQAACYYRLVVCKKKMFLLEIPKPSLPENDACHLNKKQKKNNYMAEILPQFLKFHKKTFRHKNKYII